MGSDALVVATVNVNGIRAAFRRGMAAWLAQAQPDVLLLQEVRAPHAILTDHLGPDWHLVHHEAPAAGRAGVAIASRLPFLAVRLGLPEEPEVSVGRWVECDLMAPDGAPVTVISTYVHIATANTPSMDVKLAFLERASSRLAELAAVRAVVGGDLNVAHDHRDIKNWKGNRGKSGFLPQEQAHLSRWREAGWVDSARTHAGDVEGPYTWWSWRGRAYDNDAGWRIDYLWFAAALAGTVSEVAVDRAPTYAERWSDHAPVRAVLELR